MNFMPKRRKSKQMMVRLPSTIVSHGHLKWVRGHECCIAGRKRYQVSKGAASYDAMTDDRHVCEGRIEAHHSTTRGAGGGDETVVPLCSAAHKRGHDKGWLTFAREWRVDLDKIAAGLWRLSPHGRKHRLSIVD